MDRRSARAALIRAQAKTATTRRIKPPTITAPVTGKSRRERPRFLFKLRRAPPGWQWAPFRFLNPENVVYGSDYNSRMHVTTGPLIAGLVVGLVVGMTGSGGGALLTPALILFLHVKAKTAVASDLVATLFMRPTAASVHLRRKTVHWPIVSWLVIGSVPSAFVSGWVAHAAISTSQNKTLLEPLVGLALLLSGAAAVARRVARLKANEALAGGGDGATGARVIGSAEMTDSRKIACVLIGLVGGAVVGFTSVGSGTLMLVALGFTFPLLAPADLVGTDLVQAVPLVAAAALGHLLGGDLKLALTTSIVIGGIPGAFVGALVSRSIPQVPLGLIVAGVIFGSGLALVGWGRWDIVVPLALLFLGALWLWRRRRAVPVEPVRAAG